MGQALTRRVALIVEDDHDVRDLAAAVLEETDLRVVEADSAEEALYYLREHAAEVAFLFADIRLPCLMNGIDLARIVSLKWPWIKVLVTSGVVSEHIEELPRTARFLPKPWPVLEVLKEAERAVLAG
jgi:CheY-like chemotaxis protein